jgi:hypothetical protein
MAGGHGLEIFRLAEFKKEVTRAVVNARPGASKIPLLTAVNNWVNTADSTSKPGGSKACRAAPIPANVVADKPIAKLTGVMSS